MSLGILDRVSRGGRDCGRGPGDGMRIRPVGSRQETRFSEPAGFRRSVDQSWGWVTVMDDPHTSLLLGHGLDPVGRRESAWSLRIR